MYTGWKTVHCVFAVYREAGISQLGVTVHLVSSTFGWFFFLHVVLLGVIFISYPARKQSIITRGAKFPWKWRLFFKLWPMLKITLYIQTEPGKMAQWLNSLGLQSWSLDPSTCVTSRSSQHLCYKQVTPTNIFKPQSERRGRRVSGTQPL